MIKKLFFLTLFAVAAFFAEAHYVKSMPVKQLQPNGDTLYCYVSGDEFYHWLHDANGYTIVKHPSTGYYVYACNDTSAPFAAYPNNMLHASNHVAGVVSPAAQPDLQPNIMPTLRQVERLRKVWDVPMSMQPDPAEYPKTSGANHGTINNIVVFVRFNDDADITYPLDTIEAMFNDTSANAVSMRSYFQQASYGKLNIVTHFFPSQTSSSHIVSYRDSHNRAYFMPRDSANSQGYADSDERRSREFALIENAVNYINRNSPIPSTLNIDYNNDNMVDNICFIFKGTYTGWSDLLWPHKWSLYDRTVRINGKRVYTFNIQLEGSGSHYFSTSVFCHEMFHTLGAPDLYHYDYFSNANPVGCWDLMEYNQTPPQHMGAYMKLRYGNWLDSIPELRTPGNYTLHSVADQSPRGRANNCYAIPTTNPTQYYILEFRNNQDRYETSLPGTGLLVYRVNTVYNGNASFNDTNILDEVYLFKPGAFNDTTPGNYRQAYFSQLAHRTRFCDTTNPHPFLAVPMAQNVVDTTVLISDIRVSGDSVTFYYGRRMPLAPCADTEMCNLYVSSVDTYGDTWQGCYMGIEGSNGYIYASVANSVSCSSNTSCYQYDTVRICSTDTITLRWNEGLYSSEAGFTVTSAVGLQLYNHQAGEDLPGRVLARVYNPCDSSCFVDTLFTNIVYTVNAVSGNPTRGSVTGGGSYRQGAPVTLTATPARGCRFVRWTEGANLYTSNPLGFIATANATYTAWFEHVSCTLSVSSNNNSLGSVTGGGTYNLYDSAVMSAIAANGCRFVRWNDGSTVNPRTITMMGDTAFTATFELIRHTVTARSNNTVMGSVTGGGTYAHGTTATLNAQPALGYRFNHWSDNLMTNPRTITVLSDTVITAYFEPCHYWISVSSENQTMGMATGGGEYLYGDTAVLTASPRQGYEFVSWSSPGGSSTANPMHLVVRSDSSFVATFNQLPEDTTSISDVHNVAAPKVYTVGRLLVVSQSEPVAWHLYDVQGRSLHVSAGNEAREQVQLPAPGLYVVRFASGLVVVRCPYF
ncbi:MAG: M6 family metalloprotease domain-containing protein [Bacteroidales bacterium]|nr:M6 family metalloprotease domain-containing protein [Bacteroidales bacterium]